MSFLKQLIDGSFLSGERLLEAREFYSPVDTPLAPSVAFARWTERVAVLSELGSAREIAGLSDEQLAVLERQFVAAQTRPRPAWLRHAIVGGIVLMILGGLTLSLLELVPGGAGDLTPALRAAGVTSFLIGLVPLAAALFGAFSNMHLDLSYGTTGLYVGKLDEQHPWLYKAMVLVRNEAAEEYRQRVLATRGPLRGVDYVMMREVVRAQEAADQIQPARAVAQQLQLMPRPIHVVAPEPRLVRVASKDEPRAAAE